MGFPRKNGHPVKEETIIELEEGMSMKERRKYSKQFKLEAVELLEHSERSMAEIERELGITTGLLAKWRDELRQKPKKEEAFPGNGRQAPAKHGSESWSGRTRGCGWRKKS